MGRIDVGGTLSRSFRTAFGNLGVFLGTQGVIILVAALVSLAWSLSTRDVATQVATADPMDPAAASRALSFGAGGGFAGLVGAFLGLIASGLGVVVADALDRGERLGFRGAWARLKPRFGNLLLTAILLFAIVIAVVLAASIVLGIVAVMAILASPALMVVVIVLVVAASVAGIVFLLRWVLAWPVSVLEDHGPMDNLRRSAELTKGSRGSIFAVFLVIGLVAAVPVLAVVMPTMFAQLASRLDGSVPPAPTVGSIVLQWVVTTVVQLLAGFVTSVALVAIYRQVHAPPAPPEPAMGPIALGPPGSP